MVYIKQVSIRNFKSFNGRMKLKFQQGFNVITGPNGSGKSNIIDAVQFVLGELGSKRMRVPDLSGLIYDGGENERGGPRISQVKLYFDNRDRGLASDRNTVSIGRKIDRNGQSDYYLNGEKTSRRSILDLLEMSGITPGGYNIVLQGTATRLSDITASERMTALEDLVGLTEYDQKKSEARSKLNDAERKIEVATARIGEVKKQVTKLERQRNQALRFNLLTKEEQRLSALKLSEKISATKEKIENLRNEISEKNKELKTLKSERGDLLEKRGTAREQFEEFNKEATERGKTRLPLLKSNLVGKKTLKEGITNRLNEIQNRLELLENSIKEKEKEIVGAEEEVENRKQQLSMLKEEEDRLKEQIEEEQKELESLDSEITEVKEIAAKNQRRIEELTESMIPMQESLSGIEIEVNTHIQNVNSLEEKLSDLNEKKSGYQKTRQKLDRKIEEYDELKAEEAQKLEDLLQTLDKQVQQQKQIRSTVENASMLAKQAETTITEFSAKRDLWKHIVTEKKALDRIREMAEAGALPGFHGTLRSLVKIDLPNQRGVRTAAKGWTKAVVVDDVDTAVDLVRRLKKTKLGQVHFLPLEQLREPELLPELDIEGMIGPIPEIIRYNEKYAPAVHFVWGDTYLVKTRRTAQRLAEHGYRAVSKGGDLFEPEGGIIGGHWRRPPKYEKLIPSKDSIDNLSDTIKNLRKRLDKRMDDLRLSGSNLRKFTSFLDHSSERINRIDEEKKETLESIESLNRRMSMVDEEIKKAHEKLENENNLIETLQGRKERTLEQIEETKEELDNLKGIKLSDVNDKEVERNKLSVELNKHKEALRELQNNMDVQQSYVERILSLKIREAREQKRQMESEISSLEKEYIENKEQLNNVSREIKHLEKDLDEVEDEVEAVTRIVEQHQSTIHQLDDRIEHLNERRENLDRTINRLELDLEKKRLKNEQQERDLEALGYDDPVKISDVDMVQAEGLLRSVKAEKRSIGAVNQLAINQYKEYMENYKMQSVQINKLEEEKQSILEFIEEIEQEKQEHFMTAYNEICENFSSIFAKLTGGGDGRLELQKPEDPFSGGVDLYIQFPGKPMRLAGGASGGERSVAAIAYLLAIQRFLKAPFYLFDEIDAHLDDVNTSRLSDVLKETADEAQFIMVSLKDVMVHKADRIYGVFAQHGKSRVLALPIERAEVV